MQHEHNPIAAILACYTMRLKSAERSPIGLINETWFVTNEKDERFVLQRMHPAISSDVHDRINRIGDRLAQHGLVSPRVVLTETGDCTVAIDQSLWRMLTFIDGVSYDVVPEPGIASEAGRLLGKFHRALGDHDALGPLPLSVTHDLPRHLENLRTALRVHGGHSEFERIAALASDVFDAAADLSPIAAAPTRIVHGDPKLSNVLFDSHGTAICLVDLDTVGLMPLAWELGDAFRSWCNPAGEDTTATEFSLDFFRAAVAGYASAAQGIITAAEIDAIVAATETIYTELAARFCADALNECYFGWDPARFTSRSEHNAVRARGQLNAAADLRSKRAHAIQIVKQAFA